VRISDFALWLAVSIEEGNVLYARFSSVCSKINRFPKLLSNYKPRFRRDQRRPYKRTVLNLIFIVLIKPWSRNRPWKSHAAAAYDDTQRLVWHYAKAYTWPRLPGFEPRYAHMGFVVDKVALGHVFFRVLRFPLPIFLPPIAPKSPLSGAGTVGQ
jgi:hypothetical protein